MPAYGVVDIKYLSRERERERGREKRRLKRAGKRESEREREKERFRLGRVGENRIRAHDSATRGNEENNGQIQHALGGV